MSSKTAKTIIFTLSSEPDKRVKIYTKNPDYSIMNVTVPESWLLDYLQRISATCNNEHGAACLFEVE